MDKVPQTADVDTADDIISDSTSSPNSAYISLIGTTMYNGLNNSDSTVPCDAGGGQLWQYSASPNGTSQKIIDQIYGIYIPGLGRFKFDGSGNLHDVSGATITVSFYTGNFVQVTGPPVDGHAGMSWTAFLSPWK